MTRAYNRALVEFILQSCWDPEAAYGVRNPYVADADMPRAASNPKLQSPLAAHLADIRRAWKQAPLTMPERRAVFLHYGVDMSETETGRFLKLPRQTVQAQLVRGVGKLTAWLNQEAYVDGYDADDVDDTNVLV